MPSPWRDVMWQLDVLCGLFLPRCPVCPITMTILLLSTIYIFFFFSGKERKPNLISYTFSSLFF